MKISTMIAAACVTVLSVSGCSRPSGERVLETAKDAIDLYQNAGPLVTAVVSELRPTPIPTFGISHPIKAYFVLASSPNCESITVKIDNLDPVQSISCLFTEVTVRYDNWFLSTTMDQRHKAILSSPGTQITNNTTWFASRNPEKTLGKLYEFLDDEGKANLIWTVSNDLSTIGHLSGWALRQDGDQAALYEWWSEIGSDHE